ncbi:hydantoinase/oxoprolinase family protein [Syntrophomonas erecta]
MGYTLGIDAGGTFIDYFMIGNDTSYMSYKSLSSPVSPDYGIISGLEQLAQEINMTLSQFLGQVDLIVHGTTVATNAVLTRSGARTALLTTEGLIDLLEMRQGVRDDVYNNHRSSPDPLIERWWRIPIRERMDYLGQVLRPLDHEHTQQQLQELADQNIESIAITLAHSYINPEHEQALAALVRQFLPGVHISLSHQVLPRVHMYRRVSTTVLDAYVAPVLQSYLTQLLDLLRLAGFNGNMLIMQSNGGTVAVDQALQLPVMSLLSGPAAGTALVKYLSTSIQIENAIVMDMGGTSFDVSLVQAGTPGMSDCATIDGLWLGMPVIDINTIGAGGGSIAWVDNGGLLHVGPSSAGAWPGPACYQSGGQHPTCTDADLVLGLINPDYFLAGRLQLDTEAACQAIKTNIADPLNIDIVTAAQGIYRMVNTEMAAGIKEITLEKGYDPRHMTLVVGGGAGPLHAAYVAKELGIRRLILPRESSVMCALGMLCCSYRRDYYQYYFHSINDFDWLELESLYGKLWSYALQQAPYESLSVTKKKIFLRYQGQHYELGLDILEFDRLDSQVLSNLFHNHHYNTYGYDLADLDTEIEIVGLSIVVQGTSWQPPIFKNEVKNNRHLILKGSRLACLEEVGSYMEIPVYDGDALYPGYKLFGPALIEQRHSTVVVPTGFVLSCPDDNSFIMEQIG